MTFSELFQMILFLDQVLQIPGLPAEAVELLFSKRNTLQENLENGRYTTNP